jgi:hypothetical protein
LLRISKRLSVRPLESGFVVSAGLRMLYPLQAIRRVI